MKHLLLSLLFIAITGNLIAQQQNVDTILTESWNGTAWENDIKTANTYDANCTLLSTLLQDWDPGTSTWVNTGLLTYTYGSSGEQTEQLIQFWNSGTSSWDNQIRNTFTYDGSLKLLSFITDIWLTNAWTPFSQTTYSYDANNYVDSILSQSLQFNPPQNTSLQVYTNNGNGTPAQILLQTWDLVASGWVNASMQTFTYNTSDDPATVLTQLWMTNAWVNSQYSTFTYDGSGRLSSILHQLWNGIGWDDDTRDTYSYVTSCTLPLKLIAFSASRNNNTITLSWQTAEEINTSHFNIQRSVDGIHFSSIGNINAKGGGSQTNSYSYIDNAEKIFGDKAYYRLQMIDKDGKFTYSKIVPVTLELFAGKLKVYPNPVKDQLYILFNMQGAAKAELRITDAAGKAIISQRIVNAQNNNAISINVSALSKGVYYVQVITDKGAQKTQFIKQ